MGTYINKGNYDFSQVLNSTYVDKSGLISVVNGTLFTEQRRSCVTRSRRFGKSMAANMLCAYYDRSCDNFWASTGAYDKVVTYIDMNFEGLKDDIISMIAGGTCPVRAAKFSNDMHDIKCKDDVLTVLIHLGYLAYNPETRRCYIPNFEVKQEMENAVEDSSWRIAKTITDSCDLLDATLGGDADYVAKAIDQAHDENTSILSYNNENSLACVLTIAYIYAQNDYIVYRELATGKGFADLVLIPRRNVDKPAIVLELKYKKDVEAPLTKLSASNT